MNKKIVSALVSAILVATLAGCSTPEEKAQKYFDKGMALLDTDPAKAKLEFQNALQMKKNMTPAIYGMALAAEKQADWQACFVLLNKVLDEDPQHIEATVKVGQLFLAAGELEKAKEKADKALAINKENLNAIVLQASIELKQQNYAGAVEKAKYVLSKEPKNSDAMMVLASERYSAKDIAGTLALLDKGLSINEQNLIMHLFKIQVLESSANIAVAESAYKKVIEVFPENFMIRTKLAEFYYNHDKKAEAETQLRFLVEKQPDIMQPKVNLIKYLTATQGDAVGRAELEKMVAKRPEDYELSFYLMSLYEQQKDVAAVDALLNAIIKNAGDKPEGLKAKIKVASKMLKNKQKEEAVKLVDEVLAVDGGQQDALLIKAGIAMDERRYDDAIIELRSILRDQPNASQALYLMAKTYELTGSNALAEESYTKAIETSKSAPVYGNAYAKYLMGKNDESRAEKILEDVLKRHATDAEAIKLLAQVKIYKGDLDGAKLLAERVKRLSNSNLSQLIEGVILAKNNDYVGSLNAFMKAHEAAPNDIQPILAIVRTYLSKKNFKEALAFLEATIVKSPNNYDLKILLAQASLSSGNVNKAVASYESAIALNSKRSLAYQQLAGLYISRNDLPMAKNVVQKGLSLIPNSFDLEMVLAEIYQYDKNYTEALSIYERLMKSNPESLVALNNYVSMVTDFESDKSKLQNAYKFAQQLKSSNVPQFLDTLGWISYRVGKYEEALPLLDKAIKSAPDYAIFHYHLGKVLVAKQDNAKAKQHLEKALELNKGQNVSYSADIKEMLKTI